jgi:hypothetical protein
VSISEQLFKEEEEAKPEKKGTYLVTCEVAVVEGDEQFTRQYFVLCKNPDDDIVHRTSPRVTTRTLRAKLIESPEALALLSEALLG